MIAFALALVGSAPEARADKTGGVCNSIIAQALGPAQQLLNGVGDPEQQCTEVANAFGEFLFTPGCVDALQAGEIIGLGGAATAYVKGQKAGQLKPIGETICGSLCACGVIGPAQAVGACPNFVCR
jgi:hypothetical protein